MSENIKVVESPKHFMVLDAVSRGVEGAGKIAKVTKADKAEVEMILNDLAAQRLVVVKQKKGFFSKSLQARVTDTGNELLSSKKQELKEKAGELRAMYRNGDRRGMESLMEDNRAWLPMMIFSGIMSAVMFASMMSFMGMAMNPAEAAMAGEATSADAQSADTQPVADGGGSADSSGFDAGGDDLGGDFEF